MGQFVKNLLLLFGKVLFLIINILQTSRLNQVLKFFISLKNKYYLVFGHLLMHPIYPRSKIRKIFTPKGTNNKSLIKYIFCHIWPKIPKSFFPKIYNFDTNHRQGHEFHLSLVKNKYLKFRNFFENLDLILKI
jgi:hypothetical protein